MSISIGLGLVAFLDDLLKTLGGIESFSLLVPRRSPRVADQRYHAQDVERLRRKVPTYTFFFFSTPTSPVPVSAWPWIHLQNR